MLSSDYNNCLQKSTTCTKTNGVNGTSVNGTNSIVLCEGVFVTELQRFQFIQQNFQDSNIKQLAKAENTLYGSIGFPFESVEHVLASTVKTNFLYVLLNSVVSLNHFIYDEYVFKNFPLVCQLFKQLRQGGDIVVFRKRNNDVLFVKIHNIYDGDELLHMSL